MALRDILTLFGKEIVTDLRNNLDKKVRFGGGGSSRLSARIRFEIKQDANSTTFQLLMPEYGRFVNDGRSPGPVSKQGRESIKRWVKRKGILGEFIKKDLEKRKAEQKGKKKLKKMPTEKAAEALTYLAARKIKNKGYKGNGFIDEVVNDGRQDDLRKQIAAQVKQGLLIEIRSNK